MDHAFYFGNYHCSWCGVARHSARKRRCDHNLIQTTLEAVAIYPEDEESG